MIQSNKDGARLIYRLTTSVLEDIATELAELTRLGQAAEREQEINR